MARDTAFKVGDRVLAYDGAVGMIVRRIAGKNTVWFEVKTDSGWSRHFHPSRLVRLPADAASRPAA